MDKIVGKWTPGASCAYTFFYYNHSGLTMKTDGPVLTQTDLYLLNTDLELNPILGGKVPNPLQFHLVTGANR